jgi:outer membrane receptor protein involved in Fe transport
MDKSKTSKFRARLAGGAAGLALLASSAYAQNADFSLPAQPLSDSLMAIAKQTGESILFSPQALAGVDAKPLKGQMSARNAVKTLLKGTHLEAAPIGSDGLVIRPVAERRSDVQHASVLQLAQAAPPPPPARPAPEPAPAPEPVSSNTVEQVIVSASRINIAGYQQPTPVTVVGADQLERDAKTDVGDIIRQLPAFGSSSGPNNSVASRNISAGNAGVDMVNLRNLGILRTLVLVDSQRVVASNITGGVDLSTVPTTLLQRVDVVTGGASAAWGSDAVAGVVNLIINKNFEGFKANIEGGISYLGDRVSYKAEASYGFSFDGDRGHVILSGAYSDSPNIIFPGSRRWFRDTQLVNNPAFAPGNGQPQYIHADHVGYAQATQGGLITDGPLKNIQFVGPAGTPVPFNPGNVSGLYSNGGDGDTTTSETNALAAPHSSATIFAYGSYKLTPDLKLSVQLNYGKASVTNNATPARKFGTITIRDDNPFLPSSIVSAMATAGITSFKFGTINNNNLDMNNLSLNALGNSVGVPVNRIGRQMYRGVFSLDGSVGDWAWNFYYQHGEARVHSEVTHNLITANFNRAVDAVQVTPGNVGTSGLVVGSVACRSTLTDPTNGCQPLNVFGNGVASQAAINYVNDGNDFQLSILNQDVVAGSMQGELPWALPAGPVAVAFGGEYRRESGRVTAAALAQVQGYTVGNFAPFHGSYDVSEGFVEIDGPILKDSIVQSLDFNTAGRITSYSTSGMVETWKLGLTSQVNDDIRLRATWSFDIRAPNLSELFAAGTATANQAIDPHSGQPVNIFSVTQGNPDLKPEKSTTISGGVVLSPHWVPGLNVSLDWYSISIKGAIFSTGASTELAQCNAGVAYFCSQLVFGSNGALSRIIVSPLNAASATTSGLDFQTDYATELGSGTLGLRLIGNYTDEQTQTALGVVTDYAGSLGSDSRVSGIPKFKATASATYQEAGWQATVQGRFIGSARLNNAWGPLDVDDNSIPPVAYLDLRGSYKWNDNIQFYVAVDNTLNTPPPSTPSTQSASSYLYVAIRDDIYDSLGRMYRAGVRFSF